MAHLRAHRGALAGFIAGAALAGLIASLPAWALSCNNCVDGSDIVNGSVTTHDLKDGNVSSADIGKLPSARVFNAFVQSIPTAVFTPLTFPSEDFDYGNLHSTASNTRLTAPRAGLYLVGVNILWAANASGDRRLAIRRNGAVSEALDVSDADGSSNRISTLVSLALGDYLEAVARQDTGGNLDTALCGTSSCPVFWMTWQAAA